MSPARRVLVTGASGFLGRHTLSPLLARGFDVHALSLRPVTEPLPAAVTPHCANLLNAASRRALMHAIRPTHLLHLAWYVTHGKFWEAPENLDWTAASLELLRDFADVGGERAVIAGTCAEYDWNFGVCKEDSTPLKPRTLYGTCKLGLHTIARRYFEGLKSANKPGLAWGRVFFLYGPDEAPTRLVPSVIQSLLRGEPALCTHGRQIRDFMHIDDAGSAFAALLDSPVVGAVNIASGEPHPVSELVGALGAEVGRPDLIRLGAVPLAESEPLDLRADVMRLRGEVGFTPAFSLQTGIKQTTDWWRNR